MKESAGELTTKVLKCEKDDQGSLDLVVQNSGDFFDINKLITIVRDYCIALANDIGVLSIDTYGDIQKRILAKFDNQVASSLEVHTAVIKNTPEDIRRLIYTPEIIQKIIITTKDQVGEIIGSEKFRQNSKKDGLTGLDNRNHLNDDVRKIFNQNVNGRYGQPPMSVSVIMFDADNFKRVNDTFGHYAGDQILVQMANIMKNFVREGDFCIRYGGEEFTFILFNCSQENAIKRGEQFRKMIESFKTEINQDGEKITIPMTVSIGVATYDPNIKRPEDEKKVDIFDNLIVEADKVMYESKNNGRNNLAYNRDGELVFTKNNISLQQDRKKASAI